MNPREFNEVGDLVESLSSIFDSISTSSFVYSNQNTIRFRKNLAELRSKTNQIVGLFPADSFPIANKAVCRFADKLQTIIAKFPGEVDIQKKYSEELKNIWFLEVRPAVYQIEITLAITGGVLLPEDPTLFRGKDTRLRDIAFEVNICYRNGACNACSVMLRRLIETMIIKCHEKNGTENDVKNAAGNFYKLEALIDDIISNNRFSLTRNAKDALPKLKRLGDWGAHNRNISVRSSDLQDIKSDARLCFEELLNLT
jgi:hypothetical protein